ACEPPLDRGVYDRVRALGHVRPVPSGDRLVDELETIGVIVDGPVFASHGNDTAVANLENASLLPGREPLHTIPNVHRCAHWSPTGFGRFSLPCPTLNRW